MNHPTKQFSIKREFNAPKQKVFNAFSKAEALAEWWGPVGSKITVKSFDFSPGGKFHYKMEANGQSMWGLFAFRAMKEPDMIEFVNSFSDEAGNIVKPPFDMDIPLEILNHLTFTEHNGITTIVLTGHPLNATEEQQNVYNSITQSMNEGFNLTFNQLEAYLERH